MLYFKPTPFFVTGSELPATNAVTGSEAAAISKVSALVKIYSFFSINHVTPDSLEGLYQKSTLFQTKWLWCKNSGFINSEQKIPNGIEIYAVKPKISWIRYIGVSCPSPPKGTLRIYSIKENVSESVCPTRFRDILVIIFVRTDTAKLRFFH